METPFKDSDAFKVLFKQYFTPLVNFVYSRYIKDYEIAKDIVQSTFGKIWEKKDSIEISTSVKSYLFQSAKNKSLDYLRANKEKTLELQDDFRDYDIEDKVDNRDMNSYVIREQIVLALEGMKPKMKQIFELNKFSGFSYEEIANDMEISKRTVESNMAKAFAVLRNRLKESELFNILEL